MTTDKEIVELVDKYVCLKNNLENITENISSVSKNIPIKQKNDFKKNMFLLLNKNILFIKDNTNEFYIAYIEPNGIDELINRLKNKIKDCNITKNDLDIYIRYPEYSGIIIYDKKEKKIFESRFDILYSNNIINI